MKIVLVVFLVTELKIDFVGTQKYWIIHGSCSVLLIFLNDEEKEKVLT